MLFAATFNFVSLSCYLICPLSRLFLPPPIPPSQTIQSMFGITNTTLLSFNPFLNCSVPIPPGNDDHARMPPHAARMHLLMAPLRLIATYTLSTAEFLATNLARLPSSSSIVTPSIHSCPAPLPQSPAFLSPPPPPFSRHLGDHQ